MTYDIVRDTVLKANARRFVAEQLDNAGTQIVSYDVDRDSMALRVVAVGRELSDSAIAAAGRLMGEYKMGKYALKVIQGTESDSVMQLNNRLTTMRATSENYSAIIRDREARIAYLQARLNTYEQYDAMAPEVAREAATLFPALRSLSLSLSAQATPDTSLVEQLPTAIATLKRGAALPNADRRRLADWLETRLGVDSLVFVIKN